ncbi:accessory factor associated with RNA polymerase II [Pseudogymnoascus australis]
MASADGTTPQQDALLLLRQSIASDTPALPSLTSSAPTTPDLPLSSAQHLHFPHASTTLPLTTPTRFTSSSTPVDLRSIYFAWLKREVAIPDYNAAALALNSALSATDGAGGAVQNLAFVERLDLITWLEGASEESEYIRPLAADAASAAASAQVASGKAGGIAPVASGAGRGNRTVDPRLQEIYNGERRMGDRNSVLRGVKPTDFSHVRKIAQSFIGRKPGSGGAPPTTSSTRPTALPHNPKPTRRPDPIILVSPSASSLLRMSNIKAFLESGSYTPPDASLSSSTSNSSILHLARLIPSIDTTRPIRFIVVDSPEQFKPEYWARVVAVFTTGQTWQFKNYKWQAPQELFRHALGVYVGWRGEPVPDAVRGWGRGVVSVALDPWSGGKETRWRDREGVEAVWRGVEEIMRVKGWSKDSGPVNA